MLTYPCKCNSARINKIEDDDYACFNTNSTRDSHSRFDIHFWIFKSRRITFNSCCQYFRFWVSKLINQYYCHWLTVPAAFFHPITFTVLHEKFLVTHPQCRYSIMRSSGVTISPRAPQQVFLYGPLTSTSLNLIVITSLMWWRSGLVKTKKNTVHHRTSTIHLVLCIVLDIGCIVLVIWCIVLVIWCIALVIGCIVLSLS